MTAAAAADAAGADVAEADAAEAELATAARSLCVCCAGGLAAEYTAVQRKPDGICLHSCEYRGGEGVREGDGGGAGARAGAAWAFVAPLPRWVAEALRGGGAAE